MDRQAIVNAATRLSGLLASLNCKCFLAFGSLLHFIRDRQLCLTEDIDIGIVTDDSWKVGRAIADVLGSGGHTLTDDQGQVWQASYPSGFGPILDVFFWRKKGGMYYHTYDGDPGHPPVDYLFKGIPAACFDVDTQTIEAYQRDMRYGRTMSDKGTWMKVVPGIEEECIELPLPFAYGQCLDWWYPEWATERKQFGVSDAAHRFTTKTCKGIKWN